MPAYNNVNGIWKENTAQYTRVSGVWREIDKAYTRVSGVWREVILGVNPYDYPIGTRRSDWMYHYGIDLVRGAISTKYNRLVLVKPFDEPNYYNQINAINLGVNGWVVPESAFSISSFIDNEIADLYVNRYNIGNFSNTKYWSRRIHSSGTQGQMLNFSNGSLTWENRSIVGKVRLIRYWI